MLKDKIAAVEAQMRAKLEETRATFTHPGDKGTSVEDSFRTFLRQYLPRRLELGHGEIVDRKGQRSKQTDVVIVSEEHPFSFTSDLPGLFFVDGVCAAGEIKTSLTGRELEKSLGDSCQFKQLTMDPGKGTMAHSNPSDLGRFYTCPPYFLVGFKSQLKLPTILEKIKNFMRSKGFEINEINKILDAVFIIDCGWIINFGDGKGSFQFRTPAGESVEGWVWKKSDSVLFDLLSWLSVVMPRMFRFEPILPHYIIPHN
jgi:hypothetical protein